MTGLDQVTALIAMIPAALNPSLSLEQSTIKALVCGSGKVISIPLGPPRLPGTVPSTCCAKGCHAARRKTKTGGDN